MANQHQKQAGGQGAQGNEIHPAGKRSDADSHTGGDVPVTYQPESGQPGERDPSPKPRDTSKGS